MRYRWRVREDEDSGRAEAVEEGDGWPSAAGEYPSSSAAMESVNAAMAVAGAEACDDWRCMGADSEFIYYAREFEAPND